MSSPSLPGLLQQFLRHPQFHQLEKPSQLQLTAESTRKSKYPYLSPRSPEGLFHFPHPLTFLAKRRISDHKSDILSWANAVAMPGGDSNFSPQGVSEDTYPESRSQGTSRENDEYKSPGGGMLTMDFSAPLTDQARAERIKQMSKKHPAFEKTRAVQEVLYNVQTSLRRMPGVSSAESNEINSQLQEVAVLISQETSQLVDAIGHHTLDNEDLEKSVARMSIENTIAKATTEDKAQKIRDLEQKLEGEMKAREVAENEVKRMVEELRSMGNEFADFKKKARANSGSPDSQNELIKSFEAIIEHLEQQVNNRRSLWVMKHQDPAKVAQAIESMANAIPDKDVLAESLSALTFTGNSKNSGSSAQQNHTQNHNDRPDPRGPAPMFHQIERPGTVAPPPFSPLQAGPPRPPTARPQNQNRPFSGWGQGNTNTAVSRTVSTSTALSSPGNPMASPTCNRVPSRRGFQNPSQTRYRPNAPEFQSVFSQQAPARPGTAFGHHRGYYPSDSAGRSRHGHVQDSFDSGLGGMNGALVPRGHNTGPLIHLTERSVTAWSKQVANFYRVIRNFVGNNAGEPKQDLGPAITAAEIWGILVRTYCPLSEMEAGSYLEFHLRDQNAKKCLVTRVVVDYVVNLVWVPGAWKGADEETTANLIELEVELRRTSGQTSSARQPLLDRQASIIDAIMKDNTPESQFYRSKIQEIAGSLLTNLKPLLDNYVNINDAYGDLLTVAEQAWDLSSKILTSRLTFDFRFPEIGNRFSSQSMIPIWPPHVDPMELQARHWRVALVTTPVITCRNDTGTSISAHSVALADVICMQ